MGRIEDIEKSEGFIGGASTDIDLPALDQVIPPEGLSSVTLERIAGTIHGRLYGPAPLTYIETITLDKVKEVLENIKKNHLSMLNQEKLSEIFDQAIGDMRNG